MVEKTRTSIEGEWECNHCGYIEVGVADEPPKKDCPECGAPANIFVFYPYEYTDVQTKPQPEEVWGFICSTEGALPI